MSEYIVQPGDSLWSIARKHMGDGRLWKRLTVTSFTDTKLYVGQRIWIPDGMRRNGTGSIPQTDDGEGRLTARIALARGYMFVVVEVLPDIGADAVIRKESPGNVWRGGQPPAGSLKGTVRVIALPRDFSMAPSNPAALYSPAEHALGRGQGGYLSASTKRLGAPTMDGVPLIIDMNKARASGAQVFSVPEVVADLRRFVASNPAARHSVERLIDTIVGAEQEVLIRNTRFTSDSVRVASEVHQVQINAARNVWNDLSANKISRDQAMQRLAQLEKSYALARTIGRYGRVLTVLGLIITAVDVARATRQSAEQRSFRPIAAEAVRQAGGWGGAWAGAKIGFIGGAALGIETGPGLIVTGALGALIFGAAGYFGADWLADHISPN
ncbi:LysM peptidoglycan-binding domain-containing protein [Achromobacter sp. NFACC18-2]|uniref:LysM peptidoglycan-binding domain-containing protein n=1 Tax=Achromobacter sp. NFACC18-2 TaxID=1564112 RepID=UPI0008C84A98|nr:LysM peptidoglycan-binding domain-containing protein [Achromobacter sp. NFACC18-2]SEK02374.1 LysM domain-containing protein [Achromobacter sp. NFACC18-2]